MAAEGDLTNELYHFLTFTTHAKNASLRRFWPRVKIWHERNAGHNLATFETKRYIYSKFRVFVQTEFKIPVTARLVLHHVSLEDCICFFLNQYKFKSTNGLQLRLRRGDTTVTSVTSTQPNQPEVQPNQPTNQPFTQPPVVTNSQLRSVFVKNVENTNLRLADLELQIAEQRNDITVLKQSAGKFETVSEDVKVLQWEQDKLKTKVENSRAALKEYLGRLQIYDEHMKKMKAFKVHQEMLNKCPNTFIYPATPSRHILPDSPLSGPSSVTSNINENHTSAEQEDRKNDSISSIKITNAYTQDSKNFSVTNASVPVA